MGQSSSTPKSEMTEDQVKMMTYGLWAGIGILVVFAVIVVIFKFSPPLEVIKKVAIGASKGVSTSSSGKITELPWGTIIAISLGIMSIYYFASAISYKTTKGLYRSTQASIDTLTNIQQAVLSSALDSLPANDASVCKALTSTPPTAPYGLIITNNKSSVGDGTALVNWRPLTVRVTGYLGGNSGSTDGVFSMAFGVDKALRLGARGFMFDIDYLDSKPCEPVIIHRDDYGVMRSLHTGSIYEAATEIAAKAFSGDKPNYDPVLIIVYLRRIPPGPIQQNNFFGAIASALNPFAEYHLGQTDKGNYHNCRSESQLFYSPITDYQKKIIIITNHDTTKLPSTPNPKDNLDWWTNARIYQDPSGISSGLGAVTVAAPSAPPAVALVGHIDHLLNIGKTDLPKYQSQTQGTFSIAIGPPDFAYTTNQVNTLLNILGIQCVPLDVLGLGILEDHVTTVKWKSDNPVEKSASNKAYPGLDSISTPLRASDILSFWTYSGWSFKPANGLTTTAAKKDGFQDFKEGFEEVAPIPPLEAIPAFIIPKPVPPKMPSPAMNSNGGLVHIS